LKTFFRKLGAFLTGVRVWAVNLLVLITLIYIVGVVVVVIKRMPGSVDPAGKVLIIAPEGQILDQEVFPDKVLLPFADPSEKQIQSRDLIKLIRAAAADDELAGVLLDFGDASFAGSATALNIAQELRALRDSGKPVIAFSESLSTASYLMAAQAQEIFVHPSGAVAISGIGGYRDYTRELTDKLKITFHNYSQGDYKSAVEGYTRTNMSDPDKEQRLALYGPIWSAMKTAMGEGRGVDPETFQQIADNHPALLGAEAGYDNLAYAKEQGLIDGTLSFPNFRSYMMERFGKDEDSERDTYPHIGAGAYMAQLSEDASSAEESVAVVFVQGAIQPGPQGPGVAGSDDIAALLRTAHEKDTTRAVVLRVNSPGGSIIASDIIRQELLAARNKGMPVVVSMGDVAASGGVWVSTPAQKIFVEPTTITGSIGVALAFPTLENVFDYIGVNFDGVTTSRYAGWGLNMPVDEQMDAIFARWAGGAYQHFIDLVAESRDKDPDYIRSIAGGRVWLAPDAMERGLVDETGTMEQAIAAAAQMASLADYQVDYVVKSPSAAVLFMRQFGAQLQQSVAVNPVAARAAALFDSLQGITEPRATIMCNYCSVELR
jgi:protease IV